MLIPMNAPLINIENNSNAVELPITTVEKLITFVAQAENKKLAEVDLLIVDSAEMAEMNEQYLSHEGDTDVITFDLTDSPAEPISVQLIICDEVAIRQGKENNLPAEKELLLYIIHGLLHTMGYDDKTPEKFKIMHARQIKLLEDFLSKDK